MNKALCGEFIVHAESLVNVAADRRDPQENQYSAGDWPDVWHIAGESAMMTMAAMVMIVERAQVPYIALAEYPPCQRLRSTADCLFSSIFADAAFINVSRAD